MKEGLELTRRQSKILGSRACLAAKDQAVLEVFGGQFERVVVGAMILRVVEYGHEVLVLRRAPSEEFGGIEELPSGTVEPGETIETALRREVMEETGILMNYVSSFAFAFAYAARAGRSIQLNYVVRHGGDDPVRINADEHSAWRWLRRSELQRSDLTVDVCTGLLGAWPELGDG